MGICIGSTNAIQSTANVVPVISDETASVISQSLSTSVLSPDVFSPTSTAPTMVPITGTDIQTFGFDGVCALRHRELWGL